MFEPLALAYIERSRDALARGDYSPNDAIWLEGMLPKFKRGELVEIEMGAFSGVYAPFRDLSACSAEDKALLEAVWSD